MQGKYSSYGKFLAVRIQRTALRLVLRPMMRWSRLDEPRPGYSIVIACHAHFARMLIGNLRQLMKQDLSELDRVIICFDGPKTDELERFEREAKDEFEKLNILCVHQSSIQSMVLRRIGWGWVDCWLSYAKGIAASRTRWVMLHDMDAFLLREDLIATRLEQMKQSGAHFMGIRWYEGNGVEREDRLCYIVEMMLDAQFLRRRFVPLDLFNHVCRYKGRSVDFDTLLYPQSVAGGTKAMPLEMTNWVHPSQVISQFTYLKSRPVYVPPESNNLFFIPYFMYLADDRTILEEHRQSLENAGKGPVEFLGGKMDLSQFTRTHFDWIRQQVERLEEAVAGGMRNEVRVYLEAVGRFAN
ncbi:MAG: hypothetical protein IT447_08395 [Phycisphaerales bacterium]|nr:hypothetical protein [Phycisphaerales bacterium]